MKVLLDTHVFLFAIMEPDRLSQMLRELLADPTIARYISVVSFWEITTKIQIGKLRAPPQPDFLVTHMNRLAAQPLPITLFHTGTLAALPLHHRDPFDRMLIAQAIHEGMAMATHDRQFAAYDVPLIS
jgi:PIN domain nuclease of toxin-antitoxin system